MWCRRIWRRQTNYTYYNDDINDDTQGYKDRFSTYYLVNYKKGVCNAISGLARMLGKEAGLEIIDIFGRTYGGTYHSWNMVKIDGNWYHVDFTMSLEKYRSVETYYLISDATRKRTATWTTYPAANNDWVFQTT